MSSSGLSFARFLSGGEDASWRTVEKWHVRFRELGLTVLWLVFKLLLVSIILSLRSCHAACGVCVERSRGSTCAS